MNLLQSSLKKNYYVNLLCCWLVPINVY